MAFQVTGPSSAQGVNPLPAQTWINTTILQACLTNTLPSTALLQYAATHFNLNLNNAPFIQNVPSDVVKMKLYNLAHAGKTADGKMNFGPDYNFTTLSPRDMACIYRILNAYQSYELDLRPQTAIFPIITATLNQYFLNLCMADIVKANAIIDALLACNDPKLDPMLQSMRDKIVFSQYQKLVVGNPCQTIENTPAINPLNGQKIVYACWAISLMQLVFHIPSLEQTMLTSPVYQREAFKPFREFIQKFRAAEEQGNKGVCKAVDIRNITKALSELSGEMLADAQMQDASEGLIFLTGDLPSNTSINCRIKEITENREEYNIDCPMIPVSVQNFLARQGNGQALLREYFFPRESGSAEYGLPQSRKFVTAPHEMLINMNRALYIANPNPLVPPTQIKISSPIAMPERLTLPSEYFVVNDGDKSYECDFFIVHDGPIPQAGHYIAYAKYGSDWWVLNDSWSWKITPADAKKAFDTASIYHYKQA